MVNWNHFITCTNCTDKKKKRKLHEHRRDLLNGNRFKRQNANAAAWIHSNLVQSDAAGARASVHHACNKRRTVKSHQSTQRIMFGLVKWAVSKHKAFVITSRLQWLFLFSFSNQMDTSTSVSMAITAMTCHRNFNEWIGWQSEWHSVRMWSEAAWEATKKMVSRVSYPPSRSTIV